MSLVSPCWILARRTGRFCRALSLGLLVVSVAQGASRHTVVGIEGDAFTINGQPTLKGRIWGGSSLEGLLPNARLVQGIFDDQNPETQGRWIYPDTGRWDPERNTTEFIAAMADWRRHGLLAFTLNLQGGSPMGYGNRGWYNSALSPDGSLRADYMARAGRIIDRADELGMVVILGVYYFGQDQHLTDDDAVRRGLANVVGWIFGRGYTNVLLEIDNECTGGYHHALLKTDRVPELVDYAKSLRRDGRRLLFSVSLGGGKIPTPGLAAAVDFFLLHGNGVKDPARIGEMVRLTRNLPGAANKPVVFNEDDHYDFDRPMNNFVAAVRAHASWGFFDYRRPGEPFADGFQSVPTDWEIDSPRKRGFFDLLARMSGSGDK